MAIRISEKDLAKDLRRRFRASRRGVDKALRKATQRGRSLLARRTPVDTGHMKNAWRATKTGIINDAPHAGIIETGARRHKVNRAGIEALAGWAQRVLGVDEKEARGVAFAIASKLAKRGQKGKFIVRDALPELRKFVRLAFEQNLRNIASKKLAK